MSDALVRNRYFDELCATPDLAWLGQNTNHIPTHPSVKAAMIASIEAGEFNAYAPPLGFESLRAAIIADLGVSGAEAMVTDGGVNALATICKARCKPGTTFVTSDPTWKWPCLFARQQGAEVIELPIYDAAQQYKMTPEQLRDAVDERTAVIYLVDPNNPLGVRYTQAEIEAFVSIAEECGALLVHDCTYRDFAEGHYPALKTGSQNVVVTVSFSKWLGLAGMRIGALIAPSAMLDEFAGLATGVLGASVIAQRAAEAGLKIKAEWMEEVRAIDNANKADIHAAISAIPGFSVPVYPSHGNFLVVETIGGGIAPEALVAAYLKQGVMIRQGTYHTQRFGDRFVKISTSVPREWAQRFCALLPQMVEEARGLDVSSAQF
ncbi:pyridoxal phosphate-dependent aminotransferase [Pseudomonas matsuisoli]|uniref:Aminotransferase n=1 Tax=Pseudomonas matsuisoli TaxID=1515666 RepID=A0A917V143_9PSED|nr:pyridoxal phosphate-dependent aminotransferase [Pseudomonas matsuisoli]GGK07102.1 aminotransferase [Pseudomonas matsuisoli]